ncbi:MAG: aminotransferase class V-fold PLP-dependent enzyme, partial [Acidobacteriota bacterium]
HAQHGPIDVRANGCDFLAFSGYKIFGPMLGVLWGKATVLDTLKPYRVETARNAIPVKFEQGMLPNASLAAMGAALEYLLELGLELADEEGWRDLSRPERFAFDVFGLEASDIKRKLWEESGVQIADGNHYSAAVCRHLERPGLCRASFAHYDNGQTARAFLEGLGRIIK